MSEKFSIDPHSSAFLLVANSQYLIKKVQKHLQKQINLLSQAYLSLTDAKKKKRGILLCVFPATHDILSMQCFSQFSR